MSMLMNFVGFFEPRAKKVDIIPQATPVAVEELREEGVIIPNRKFRDIYRVQPDPGSSSPMLYRGYPAKNIPLTLKEGLSVIRRDKKLQRKNVILGGTQMSFQNRWLDVMVGPDAEGKGLCVGCAIEREQQGLYLCWK